jgi:hypothetical protein
MLTTLSEGKGERAHHDTEHLTPRHPGASPRLDSLARSGATHTCEGNEQMQAYHVEPYAGKRDPEYAAYADECINRNAGYASAILPTQSGRRTTQQEAWCSWPSIDSRHPPLTSRSTSLLREADHTEAYRYTTVEHAEETYPWR